MTDPRMMEPRISLVTLGVRDLAASVAFYRDLIGWIPTTATDEVAFFDLGGLVFGLWPHAELAADLGLVADGLGPYHGFTIAHNVRSRDEVDAVFESLRAAGATITKAPVETDWGGYSGYFVDLDGHAWEVAHNPFWTIRDDGRISLVGD
jgi:catechol 2,3-dioxygenase-like lactoylglutathione lyase family enzyme